LLLAVGEAPMSDRYGRGDDPARQVLM